jgi:MFS family permease
MYPNARRLFVASCIALITSAFSFQMRGDCADDLSRDFQLTKELVGSLTGGQFLGMALSMFVFSFICDSLGLGRVLGLAWVGHAVGIAGTIFTKNIAAESFAGGVAGGLASASASLANIGLPVMPDAPGDNTAFWILWASAFLIGASNGLVEICINPLAATLYPDEKTHKLNVLHAWWPGGLILAGLVILLLIDPLYGRKNDLANYALDPARFGLANIIPATPIWQVKYAALLVPLVLYGLLSVGQSFPATERVKANVSAGEMFLQVLRPLFIIWAFCMLLTASTELSTNSWMESTLRRTAGVSGTLVFIYTCALMFILRFFAGPIAHKLSPVGMLFVCSILTAAGLYGLSKATDRTTAFAAATLFGIGIAYYWPTMLGVTAERFPRGGAFALGVIGCVGNLAIAFTAPYMGSIFDRYTGAALPAEVREYKVDGTPLTRTPPVPAWVPQIARNELYPPNGVVVVPEVLAKLPADAPQRTAIRDAEASGASNALRLTTALPVTLIALFGLIALFDLLRGGYKAEKIETF